VAVTAKFTADFSQFHAAAKEAEARIRSFEASSGKTGQALEKAVARAVGPVQKLAREAALLAQAVEKAGGVSTLAGERLESIGSKASQLSKKFTALGLDVPSSLQAISDKAKTADSGLAGFFSRMTSGAGGASKAFSALGGVIAGVAGAVGITLSAGAIIGFAKDAVSAAGALDDLRKETKFSTDTLQGLAFGGKRVGVSLTEIAESATQLQKKLGSGDAGVVSSVRALGIDLDQIKKLSPENQFITLAEAVTKIEDPLSRASIGADLFGKKFEEISSLASEGIRDTIEEAKRLGAVIDTDAIQSLDRLGDAFGDLGERTKGIIATALAPLADAILRVRDAARGVAADSQGPRFIDPKDAENFKKLGAAVGNVTVDLSSYSLGLKITGKAAEDLVKNQGNLISNFQLAQNEFAALRKNGLEPLNAAQKKTIDETIKLGGSEELAARRVGVSTERVKIYRKSLDELKNSQREASQELKKAIDLLEKSIPQLKLAEALEQIRSEFVLLNPFFIQAERGAQLMAFGFKGTQDALESLGENVDPATEKMIRFWATFEEAGPTAEQAKGELRSFGTFLQEDLGKLVVGAFAGGGNVGKTIGAGIGDFLTGKDGIIGEAIAGIRGKLGSVLGSVVGPLGSLLGGLGGSAVGKLFGKIFGNNPEKQINPIREAFVQAGGGLEKLGEKAARAGVTLREMLDARNPQAYQKAIENLQRAFQFQDDALKTVEETVKRYGFALSELGPALQRSQLEKQAQGLFKDFQVLTSAGIDVNTVLGRMGDSLNHFIQDAVATGTEVPLAMQPMLKKMAELGILVDKNGTVITDLEEAGVRFSITMSEGFRDLIAEVRKLTEAIARGLGVALDTVADKARHIQLPEFTGGFDRPVISDDVPSFPTFQGGISQVTRPAAFIGSPGLSEQTVTGRGQAEATGAGAGAGTVVFELNGRTLAEVLLPDIAGAVQRFRLA